MRTGISITLQAKDRRRLEAIVRDRNALQKHVWRAEIVLLTAEGLRTVEIMRRTGKSKTCVWRWQERFMQESVEGLLLRQDAALASGAARSSSNRQGGEADRHRATARGDPLDLRRHGQGDRHQRLLRAAHLARPWLGATPGPAIQALQRPAVRR